MFEKSRKATENKWLGLFNPLNPNMRDKERMDITVKTIIKNNSTMDLYLQ